MPKFVTSSPDVEVNAVLIRSILEGAQSDLTPQLKEHGITDFSDDRWYPLSDFMAFFQDLTEQKNTLFSLVSIGMSIMDQSPLPPHVTTVQEGLDLLMEIYQHNHRNEDPDVGWHINKVGDDHWVAMSNTAYPHDLEYGIIYSTVRRLCPKDKSFVVAPNERPDGYWEYEIQLESK